MMKGRVLVSGFWLLVTGDWFLAACRWSLVVGCCSQDGTWPKAQGTRQTAEIWITSQFDLAPFALYLLHYTLYRFYQLPDTSNQRPVSSLKLFLSKSQAPFGRHPVRRPFYFFRYPGFLHRALSVLSRRFYRDPVPPPG